jgi:hypothetical protein
MRKVITTDDLDVFNNQKVNNYINLNGRSDDYMKNNPTSEILTTEGSENVSQYVEERGLAKDQDIITLSSRHHYYNDDEEMRNIRTDINLKEPNQIREAKNFLQTIIQLLPKNSNFIGCFADNWKLNVFEIRHNSSSAQKKADYYDLKESGAVSNIPLINMIYNFMDLRTNKYLSERILVEMLINKFNLRGHFYQLIALIIL